MWAARVDQKVSRRLAVAALAGLLATMLADLFGYLRSERWLELPILVATVAAAGLVAARSRQNALRSARPTWVILAVAFLIVFVVVTLRLEVVPLVLWLLLGPRRTWVWGGALAWAAVLLWVPLVTQIRNPVPSEQQPVTALAAAAERGGPSAEGLVDMESLYNNASGDVRDCPWGHPWTTTVQTDGRIRPLFGLYQETSAAAEFLYAGTYLRLGFVQELGLRQHWADEWQDAGRPYLDSPARAEALGAAWYAQCDIDGNVSVTELPGLMISGVAVTPYSGDESWHRSAVEWWISPALDLLDVPVLLSEDSGKGIYSNTQAAQGVSLRTGQDSLTVRAEEAGWAWLRVPWDPDWRSMSDSPVLKGGPGHLIVWAERGETELRWSVPGLVDGAAAAVTGIALLTTFTLLIVNRRLGWYSDPGRDRPASNAINMFTDTVDGWAQAGAQRVGRLIVRSHQDEDCD